jgi:hypothetical protein
LTNKPLAKLQVAGVKQSTLTGLDIFPNLLQVGTAQKIRFFYINIKKKFDFAVRVF